MPIKATNKADPMSRNLSMITIDQQANNTTKNTNNLKSVSGANEKFSHIDGGEQQVTVNINIFYIFILISQDLK